MNIKTFKIDIYKDCPIYYRNFGKHFEYLTIIKGELYTTHITINPSPVTRALFFLKIEKLQYSEQQLKAIISQLRRLAETTIDFILKDKEKVEDELIV
jgi:RNAse (barnase) inhibitor barstar